MDLYGGGYTILCKIRVNMTKILYYINTLFTGKPLKLVYLILLQYDL